MTTDEEQLRALKKVNDHLLDLCFIRTREKRLEEAKWILRHYPSNADIERFWKKEA